MLKERHFITAAAAAATLDDATFELDMSANAISTRFPSCSHHVINIPLGDYHSHSDSQLFMYSFPFQSQAGKIFLFLFVILFPVKLTEHVKFVVNSDLDRVIFKKVIFVTLLHLLSLSRDISIRSIKRLA